MAVRTRIAGGTPGMRLAPARAMATTSIEIATATGLLLAAAMFLPLAACEQDRNGAPRTSVGDATPQTPATTDLPPAVQRAVCVLVPVGDGKVGGTIEFTRQGDDKVRVTGEVHGLTPGAHGFHVHQFGDLRSAKDGESAGGHFAGGTDHHGAPDAAKRHVGDLGNIEAGDDGVAHIDTTDVVIALSGPRSVLGRAVVVHEKADTFVQPSGAAGARVAFGVIGIARDR